MSEKHVPQPAEAAGYRHLVFNDDFDDPSTIDWEGSGKPGFNWYIDRPFNWSPLVPGDVTVQDSVATIAQQESCANWAIGTYSAKGDTGAAFRFGYFEARIRFDLNKQHDEVSGFPAWWSFSKAHTTDRNDDHWAELDFFEAMTNPTADGKYTGTHVSTIHDWTRQDGKVCNCQNPNNWHDKCVTEGWHNYGCLWTPGAVEWYYDERCIACVTYSADKLPKPTNVSGNFVGAYQYMEQEDMLLILGSCKEWPMEVDWVRVWQA